MSLLWHWKKPTIPEQSVRERDMKLQNEWRKKESFSKDFSVKTVKKHIAHMRKVFLCFGNSMLEIATIQYLQHRIIRQQTFKPSKGKERKREAQTETEIKCSLFPISSNVMRYRFCTCVSVSVCVRVVQMFLSHAGSCKYSFFFCLFICLLDLPLFTVSFADFVASFFHAKLNIMLVCSRLHNSSASFLSSLFCFA